MSVDVHLAQAVGFGTDTPAASVVEQCHTMSRQREQRVVGSHRAERPEKGRRPSDRSTVTSAKSSADLRIEQPATIELSVFTDSTTSLRPAQPGKRKAVKAVKNTARTRLSGLRGLPSLPVIVGVAALAVSAGGAVVSADQQQLVNNSGPRVAVPNALTGSIGSGSYDALGRVPTLSRDSDRDALQDSTGTQLVEEAARQAEQRDAKLGELAAQAEIEAKEIALNAWVLPLDGYRLTATYGEYGLWATYHTGLDFAAPTGTPLKAMANGVVTFVGYDGAYGNKTVITLEDGTELWYCHQTSQDVSEGDNVTGGQVIGSVGSTGNTTGPHLHLEVRPGGGDPVDPFAAMVVNGLNP